MQNESDTGPAVSADSAPDTAGTTTAVDGVEDVQVSAGPPVIGSNSKRDYLSRLGISAARQSAPGNMGVMPK